MGKGLILTLILIFTLVVAAPPARVSATKSGNRPANYAPGEIIVKLRAEAPELNIPEWEGRLMRIARLAGEYQDKGTAQSAEQLLSLASDRRVSEIFSRNGLDRVFLLKLDPSADVGSVVAGLRARDEVEYAEPNYYITTNSIPDDPNFSEQWALLNYGIYVGGYPSTPNADIKAYQAWDITMGSPEVIIALTDTGVDQTHPDLAESIYTNALEIPGNGIDDDQNGFVDDVHGFNVADQNGDTSDAVGHGTQMAGVIAAGINNGIGISGVCQSKILPVRFYKRYGPQPEEFSATVADAVKALLYSITAGASIINASWRTLLTPDDVPDEDAQALQDAVKATSDAGILLVCTAGNDGYNLDYSNVYPASYWQPNQIVAAASDFNDEIWHPAGNPYHILTGFGPNGVNLAAPGVSVLTTQARGDCVLCTQDNDPAKWYSRTDGTSISAALVSGVAALVKSKYPDDSAILLKRRIIEGVEVSDNLRPYVVNGGRLSAVGALTVQLKIVPPVLDEVRYKSKKLIVYGSGLQTGLLVIVGKTAYTATQKSADGTSFVARVPKREVPPGKPVQIKLRNPDGGESKVLTFTR